MRIPQSTVDEIRHRADIVDIARSFVELKKAGEAVYKACCPFHHEKTPSFHVNAEKQVYHCFGCGAGGSTIDFVMNIVNTDYVGALRWLAQRYSITIQEEASTPEELSKEALRRKHHDEGLHLLEDSAVWFQEQLYSPAGAEARAYLQQRGLDDETVRKFRIGYAPDGWDNLLRWAQSRGYSKELLLEIGLCTVKEQTPDHLYDRFRNRLMFTISDELSRPVAFSGRVMGPKPPDGGKYVNSPESEFFHKGQILYGYNFARQHFKQLGFALVCEGQLDVIACHRAGLEQAIASQGTAFTEEHARLLKRANVQCVHLAFDGDAAGHKATLRTIGLLQKVGMQVMITTFPEDADPDSIFKTGGAAALQQMVSVAEPAIPFALKVAKLHHPGDTPEERSAVVSELLDIISTLQDPLAAAGHCQWLAKVLHLPENIVIDQLNLRRQMEEENVRRQQEYDRNRASYASQPAGMASPSADPVRQQGFSMPQIMLDSNPVSPVIELLLELCMTSQDIALAFASEESLLDFLPDSPATQVLNQIIESLRDGEWSETVSALPESEFVTDPVVSKVLTAPQLDPKNTNLTQIYADCIRRLKLLKLKDDSAKITQEFAADLTEEAQLALLQQARELAQQRQRIRNTVRRKSMPPGGTALSAETPAVSAEAAEADSHDSSVDDGEPPEATIDF